MDKDRLDLMLLVKNFVFMNTFSGVSGGLGQHFYKHLQKIRVKYILLMTTVFFVSLYSILYYVY